MPTVIQDDIEYLPINAADTVLVAYDKVVIGGVTVLVRRCKLGFGADGAYTEVDSTNGLPVSVAGSAVVDGAQPSTLAISATGAAGAAVTATLPAVASQFHYLTAIQIVKFAAAVLVAGAAPVVVTTTNLPGALQFSLPTDVLGMGAAEEQKLEPTTPLKSTASNTATTIVCPATLNVIWQVNVLYYTAP